MSKPKFVAARYLLPSLASFAAFALGSAANAGVMVSVNFVPSVLSFSPGSAQYIFSLAVNASGFTDDTNHANYILFKSKDGAFTGDYYPATGTYSGTAGSNGYSTVSGLNTAINSTGGFTLSLVDGVTGTTSKYSLNVSTTGINPDFVRPITLNPGPDTTISSHPIFTLSQASSSNPKAQYTSGFNYLFGNTTGNPATTPFSPTETSFSPVSPLTPDSYTAGVSETIDMIDPTILSVSTPVALNGAPALGSFDYTVTASSGAQSNNLTVVPEPAGLTLLAVIGLLAMGRRRA